MRAGAERLDRVSVRVGAEALVVSWDTRERLLEWLEHLAGGAEVIERFRAVGATRAVELSATEEEVLLVAVDDLAASGRRGLAAAGRERAPARAGAGRRPSRLATRILR